MLTYLSKSAVLYIDTFEPFQFYAASPRLIWAGACGNYDDYKIKTASGGNVHDKTSCNEACISESGCTHFVLIISGGSQGSCSLYKAGCSYSSNSNYELYEKYDETDMASCKMAVHVLDTSNGSKVSCENALLCDKINLDISEVGLLAYSLWALGGPSNNLKSGTRSFRVCDPSSITSSVDITKKQAANADDKMRFKVPNYTETDSNCPAITSIKIYNKDCVTLSTSFENPSDLISTLSDGYLYARLLDETTSQFLELCLEITSFDSHSILISDLEFTLQGAISDPV